jgi:type IV pilus assembly protein PilQ
VDGKTKSIASPRVLTADSTAATISAGTEIPYATVSAAGTNVSFKPALLSLVVTPKITPDDKVNMKVLLTQDTVGQIFGGIPSINTKKVDTQVLVENGGTLVIGGVYTQNEADARNSVPLLADIPLIGWLFKNETKTTDKRELLVFITPKILSDSLNLQ